MTSIPPAFQTKNENTSLRNKSILRCIFAHIGACAIAFLASTLLLPAVAIGQVALINGGNHSDAISVAGQEDAWTFSVVAGDYIFLRASQTSGGTAFAPRIRVFDAAQNLVGRAAGADNSATSSARLDYIATTSGTFRLVVDSNLAGGTGNYRVDFLRQPGATTLPSGETGGPLANESRAEGAIALGDLDAWTFDAAPGDSVLLRLVQLSGGAAFIPRMRVFDAAGAFLAESSGASESRLLFRPVAAGTFSLVIDSAAIEGTGNYRIHRLKLPGAITTPSSDTGAPLASGGNHDGAISVGDADAWTFDATAGERVFLRAAQTSSGNAFAPRLRVYDSTGVLVGQAAGASDSSASEARLEYVPTDSGNFTVVIDSGLVGGTGNYRLFYLKTSGAFITPSGDDGRPLVSGNQDGSTTLGDLDVWTFTANAGDRVTLGLSQLTGGAGYAPRARVFNAVGNLVGYSADPASSSASTSTLKLIVPSTGTFKVVMDSAFTSGAGNYRINYLLEAGPFTPETANGTPLIDGENHEGAISLNEEDPWTLEASPGEEIYLRVGELSESGRFASWVRLYDPTGELVASESNDSDTAVIRRATVGGTYRVVISSWFADASGTYRLHYLKVPGAFTSLEDGGALQNASTNVAAISIGDMDAWTFEGNHRDRIVLRMRELTGGNNFSPRILLYGPTGQLVAHHTHDSLAQLSLVLPDGGIYTVVTDGGFLGNVGTYELTATGLPEQGRQLRFSRQVMQEQQTFTVNWPSALAGYVLQQNTTLAEEGWVDVGIAVVANGLNTRVTLPLESGNRFFRLRPPAQ